MKTLSIFLLSIVMLMGCKQAKTKDNITPGKDSGTVGVAREVVQASPVFDTLITFESGWAGHSPAGWSEYFTGEGTGTEWKIIDDNGNNVLAQVSMDNPSYHFNVAIMEDIKKMKNVEMSVRLKGVKGKMDRGGGFVWRFTSDNNYYVVRANPLEDNVVLYKVENGKRTDLPLVGKGRTYGVKVPPLGDGWNTLKLIVKDDLFTVYLNGKELFQVKDDTFRDAGEVGLRTKADAVTYFDNFEVRELK